MTQMADVMLAFGRWFKEKGLPVDGVRVTIHVPAALASEAAKAMIEELPPTFAQQIPPKHDVIGMKGMALCGIGFDMKGGA